MTTASTHPGGLTLPNGIQIYGAPDPKTGQGELFAQSGNNAPIELTHVLNTYGGLSAGPFISTPNGGALFSGNDDNGRGQLWGSDGKTAVMLTNNSSIYGFQAGNFHAFGKYELLTGNNSAGFAQVFSYDGVTLRQLTNSTPVYGLQAGNFSFVPKTGIEIFTAMSSAAQQELYATNGTSVTQLTNITNQNGGLGAGSFKTLANGTLSFTGRDGASVVHNWTTDGTASGTHTV